ncbi:hypothetical protein BdWA1_000274 [Babesia duncani]|uniref:Uncharacterized protein n=1 Tax=Babesia duncani TaxID=323732 RepID=A0AAD9UPY4_9APIC|nr:hypothetical protein BdWA1_000274 [Babesia duncani]
MEQINFLKADVESQQQFYSKSLESFESQLEKRLQFDLRRFSDLDKKNSYAQCDYFDWQIALESNENPKSQLFKALINLFQCWKSCMTYIQTPKIITDSTMKLGDSDHDEKMRMHDHPIGPRFIDMGQEINNVLENILDAMNKTKLSENWKLSHSIVSVILMNLRRFVSLQRIYLVVEEYIEPCKVNAVSDNDYYGLSTPVTAQENSKRNCPIIKFVFVASMDIDVYRNALSCLLNNISRSFTRIYCCKCKRRFFGSINDTDEYSHHDITLLIPKVKEVVNDLTLGLGSQQKSFRENINNLHSSINAIVMALNSIKSCLSHRLCYPKIYQDFYFPLTGATSEMVSLVDAMEHLIKLLDNHWLPHLQARCTNIDIFPPTNASSIIMSANSRLQAAEPRQKLSDLKSNLELACRNQTIQKDLKIKFEQMQQQLHIETLKCSQYQLRIDELEKLETSNLCACNDLLESFTDARTKIEFTINSQHQRQVEEYESKIKEFHNRTRSLISKLDQLLDQNSQLEKTVEESKRQIEASKQERDLINYSYDQQSTLMTEHLNELNAILLASEVKVAKLTQTKITCPYCSCIAAIGLFYICHIYSRCNCKFGIPR